MDNAGKVSPASGVRVSGRNADLDAMATFAGKETPINLPSWYWSFLRTDDRFFQGFTGAALRRAKNFGVLAEIGIVAVKSSKPISAEGTLPVIAEVASCQVSIS